MTKPSLHEVAAMPYSEGLKAMREHYDPKWGMPLPEPETGKHVFKVKFDWTLEGTFDDEVEAETEAEAKQIAEEWIHDDTYRATLRLGTVTIEKVGRA